MSRIQTVIENIVEVLVLISGCVDDHPSKQQFSLRHTQFGQ
jgi:hypothetical protein